MAQKKRGRPKRRERKSIPTGRAYIQSTFNNTIVTLTDPEGNVLHKDTRMALCRCGDSKNKPFCDNSHLETGFQADGAGTPRDSIEQSAEDDVLRIMVRPNKSIRFLGNFELFNGRGELLYSGCRAGLCRCGASKKKPFCDSTHNEIGWTSE